MKLSAAELNNPIYDKAFEPKFVRTKFVDTIQDDAGNDFRCEIEYHYYRYDGLSRIVWYSFKPIETFYMTEMSMDESVRDAIQQAEGYSADFECNGEFINTF